MVRRKASLPLNRQRRQETISSRLLHGDTPKQIAEHESFNYQMVLSDIDLLRKRLGNNLPRSLLPRKGKHFLGREKAKPFEEFISYAKSVIAGKEKLRKPLRKRLHAEFEQARKMLKEEPLTPDTKIAAAVGVTPETIRKWRRWLVAEDEIPYTTHPDRMKFLYRGRARGVLTDERIQQVLMGSVPLIQSKYATPLFESNRELFDFFKMSAKKVGKEIAKTLASRLEKYDPKEMSGPEKTKLSRFVHRELWLAKGKLKIAMKEKYRHALAAKQKPAKKPAVKKPEPLPVKYLERVVRGLRLTLPEEAIFYGLLLKISNPEMGRRFGLTRERVRQIGREVKELAKEILK